MRSAIGSADGPSDAAPEGAADAAEAAADGDAVAPPPDEQAEMTKAKAANGVNVRINVRLVIKLVSS
jgi:hypothetical protein